MERDQLAQLVRNSVASRLADIAATIPRPIPIICAGTKTQPACRHWQTEFGNCRHPSNLRIDYVRTGAETPHNTAAFLRTSPDHCAPAATWYEPAQDAQP